MQRRRFLAALGLVGGGAAVGGAALGPAVARSSGAPSPAGAVDMAAHQTMTPHRGSHRVIWSVEVDRPLAALTFDDGPDPAYTPEVLDVLADHGVRATFLMMGHNAARHPDLAREVVAAGHEIGNHTATHRTLSEVSRDDHEREMRGGATQIETATGAWPGWFRPPRGQLSAWGIRYAAILGQDTVMWSMDRGPAGVSSAAAVAAHLRAAGPGEIICLHDGIGQGTFAPDAPFAQHLRDRRQVELDALPTVLADAHRRGLRFVTLSELVAAEVPGEAAR